MTIYRCQYAAAWEKQNRYQICPAAHSSFQIWASGRKGSDLANGNYKIPFTPRRRIPPYTIEGLFTREGSALAVGQESSRVVHFR